MTEAKTLETFMKIEYRYSVAIIYVLIIAN